MLMFKLKPLFFFVAFAVGLLMCYIMAPTPEIVVKFPSPYNAGKVIYKDRAEGCFKYNASKVECPIDKGSIRPQPVLEDFSTSKRR
jgi:hypothetical protein